MSDFFTSYGLSKILDALWYNISEKSSLEEITFRLNFQAIIIHLLSMKIESLSQKVGVRYGQLFNDKEMKQLIQKVNMLQSQVNNIQDTDKREKFNDLLSNFSNYWSGSQNQIRK